MTKSTAKNFVPGLVGQPARTAERIIRLLSSSRAVTHMHSYEHFRRTLGIWHAALNQVKMRPWLEACAGMERGLGPLQEALELLMAEAACNYDDVIGSVYMLLSQGEKRLGQYFTPYSVARMLAEINVGDLKPREDAAPPIRILEPTCGSGVMILATAEVIERRYPGMIWRGDVVFYGVDIDPLCVMMCQINMLLHGVGHVVRLPDETGEQRRGMSDGEDDRAARYAFRPAQIVCGNSLTQDTAELFAQEAPWIPVNLVLRSPAPGQDEKPAGEASESRSAQGNAAFTDASSSPPSIGLGPVTGEERMQTTSVKERGANEWEEIGGAVSGVGGEEERGGTQEKQEVSDGHLLASKAASQEECPSDLLPLLSQDADATTLPEDALAQETVADEVVEEVNLVAASEGTEQGNGVAWTQVDTVPITGRRKRKGKDDGVVQYDLFSLLS